MKSDEKRGSKGDDAPSYNTKNGPKEPDIVLEKLLIRAADLAIKTFKHKADK